MFKNSCTSIISAAILAAAPLTGAAQTVLRGAVMGINTTPMVVTGLQSPVQATSLFNMPALSPSVPMIMAPALAPTALPVALTPAAKITAVAAVANSPLSAIQSLTVANKTPNTLFDSASQKEELPAVDQNDLNNEVDHHSSFIKLYMYQNLLKAGLNPITDARELMKPGAETLLLNHGFKRQADVEGTKIYLLRTDMNNAQSVSFYKNGSASLTSVSKPGSQLFTETISIDDEGYIFNDTGFFGSSTDEIKRFIATNRAAIMRIPGVKGVGIDIKRQNGAGVLIIIDDFTTTEKMRAQLHETAPELKRFPIKFVRVGPSVD